MWCSHWYADFLIQINLCKQKKFQLIILAQFVIFISQIKIFRLWLILISQILRNVSIVSGDGLASPRHKVITWSNLNQSSV